MIKRVYFFDAELDAECYRVGDVAEGESGIKVLDADGIAGYLGLYDCDVLRLTDASAQEIVIYEIKRKLCDCYEELCIGDHINDLINELMDSACDDFVLFNAGVTLAELCVWIDTEYDGEIINELNAKSGNPNRYKTKDDLREQFADSWQFFKSCNF